MLAVSLAACGGTPVSASPTVSSTLVAVPTQPPPPPAAGSPQACMAALLTGVLTADQRWGLVVTWDNGAVEKVIWPYGFAARADGTRLVLIDAEHGGVIIAREGDRVAVGGGEIDADGTWLACPTDIRIVAPT